MRRICIVFASVWMAFTANAQSVLKLQLRDAAGMPLEGATVTVKQQKSTLAGTAGTDGRANLRVATGSFRLQVSHTGMEAFDSLLDLY